MTGSMANEVAQQSMVGIRAVKELRIGGDGLVEGEAGPASVPAGFLLLP